jgi:ribosomal protein L37AE/L43A
MTKALHVCPSCHFLLVPRDTGWYCEHCELDFG